MTRIFQPSFSSSKLLIWQGIFLLVMSTLFNACNSTATQTAHSDHQHASQASADPTPRVPAFISDVAQARPLPAVLDPRQFSDPPVVKAYTYAKQNPEIFAQQPCYCYCDSGEGHKSLLDCFATMHGVSCPLCQKEGILVHQLVAEGKNATEIRDLINRREWQNVRLE